MKSGDVSAPDTDALVEQVREALTNYGTWRQQQKYRGPALAALTTLAERLEAAEAAHARALLNWGRAEERAQGRAEAAEAEVARLREALAPIAENWPGKFGGVHVPQAVSDFAHVVLSEQAARPAYGPDAGIEFPDDGGEQAAEPGEAESRRMQQ